MHFRISTIPVALVFAFGLGVTAFAATNPGIAVCASVNFLPLTRLEDGTLVGSHAFDTGQAAVTQQLLVDSKDRIGDTFGEPRSAPIVVFFNSAASFWPFRLNDYGSTHVIGTRTCVLIGPNGRNVDVVAHELMHAEIVDRVGVLAKFTELPTWFDEGLAMQVDFRPEYDIAGGANAETKSVRALQSAGDFYVPDSAQLTYNYASAKAEVALWTRRVGYASVLAQLERLRRGEAFEPVVGMN
ncbi:hypothetical protein SLT36_05085 [Aminobacter sp. BA135]|uniref:hypothetical protein n=1 Tax=Aminobacter sp. BA135 TaxID=537596 RepID=UPI003D7B2D0E